MLSLNNWTVPVKNGGAKLIVEEAWRGRRGDHSMAVSRNWVGRKWSITTTPMLSENGEALEHWLEGLGHTYPFDYDLYSSRSRPPLTGYTGGILATGVVKFASPVNSFLYIGGAGENISFDAQSNFGSSYGTVSFWMWINDGAYGAWHHYVQKRDAGVTTVIVNNGAGPANPSNYTVTFATGTHQIDVRANDHTNASGADVWIEDLVIVPYAWTAGQITAVYTSTQAFGMTPFLRMKGSLLYENGPVYVQAEIKGVSTVQGYMGGAWKNDLRILDFVLHEVDPFVEKVTP